jgi:hypothetical protein
LKEEEKESNAKMLLGNDILKRLYVKIN